MDESDESRAARRRAPDPVAFARDAKRAVGALVRDSIALSSKVRAVRAAVAPASASNPGTEPAPRAVEAGRLVAIGRKRKHRGPMETLASATITTERGLVGNAYGRPGRRQVTVVTREGWEAACRHLGRDVDWTVRRANLLVEGLELARRVGARLAIGDVILEITGETTPCSRMDEQVPGLTLALEPNWRAGVTCRVLRGGELGCGDVVTLEQP